MKLPAALLTAALLAPGIACAQVEVVGGWVRPPPAGAPTAAAYLTLVNRGKAPDRLVGAATPAASGLSMHSMSMAGGIMRMRKMNGLALPPGARVTLQPGGDHLMLTGLKRSLRPGDRVPVTLRFAQAGEVRATLPVQAGAGDAAAMPGMTH